LIARAGKPVPMVELIAEMDKASPEDIGKAVAQNATQSVIDEQTRQDIKRRLEALQQGIEDAERHGNTTEVRVLQRELQQLLDEYKATKTPNGKNTNFPTPLDRIRSRIFSAHKRACNELNKGRLGALADHLKLFISAQGDSFIYSPNPPLPWALD